MRLCINDPLLNPEINACRYSKIKRGLTDPQHNTGDPRELRALRAIRKQPRTMTGAALRAIYLSLYGKLAAAPGHFA